MGKFTVAYHNPNASARKQFISIYNSQGAKVWEVNYTSSLPYYLQDVDLRRHGAGVYFAVLRDDSGKKIKTGKVVVR